MGDEHAYRHRVCAGASAVAGAAGPARGPAGLVDPDAVIAAALRALASRQADPTPGADHTGAYTGAGARDRPTTDPRPAQPRPDSFRDNSELRQARVHAGLPRF